MQPSRWHQSDRRYGIRISYQKGVEHGASQGFTQVMALLDTATGGEGVRHSCADRASNAVSMMLNTLLGASAPVAPACRHSNLSRQQCISQNRHCIGHSKEGRRRSRLSHCISGKSAVGSPSHLSGAFAQCSAEAGRSDDQSTQSAAAAEDCRQQDACSVLVLSQTDAGVLRTQQPQQQLQRLQQPPWLQPPSAWQMPSAADLRTALYLVIGSLLVWRYAASRLVAGSTSFASLSLHGSFHTASQTGAHTGFACLCLDDCHRNFIQMCCTYIRVSHCAVCPRQALPVPSAAQPPASLQGSCTRWQARTT
jgi:hypothetical protein